MHVVLTVICGEEHFIGDWIDGIEEKYPFWCATCQDDARDGKYPWRIISDVIYINHVTYVAMRGTGGEVL